MSNPSERARAMVGLLVQAGVLDAAKARELYASYMEDALGPRPSSSTFGQYLVSVGAITMDAAKQVRSRLDSSNYAAIAAQPGNAPSTFVEGAKTLMDEGEVATHGSQRFTAEDRPGTGRWRNPEAPTTPGSDRWGSAVQKNPAAVDKAQLPSSQADTKTGSTEGVFHPVDGARPGSSSNEDSRFASAGHDSDTGSSHADGSPDDPGTLVVGAGATLGSYTLVELVGKGAMGQVYRAKHTASGEIVALKVLKNVGAARSSKIRKRFRREVEALRRLHHENIVRVHTYERTGPLDWYVMDFVEGRELKEVIANDELDQIQLLKIFEKVCEALAHAHDRGVVHRDLKPSNVLINEHRHVWVLDFGLAKLLDERGSTQLTGRNAALGTPYYMSPEQIQNPQSVTWKADIFTMGILLYELMTGERPFDAETSTELAKQIIRKDPTLPSKINPELGPEFDKVVMRAIAKDPRMRYRRVEDLRVAVVEYRRTRLGLGARIVEWMGEHGRGFKTGLLIATLIYLPIIAVLLVLLFL